VRSVSSVLCVLILLLLLETSVPDTPCYAQAAANNRFALTPRECTQRYARLAQNPATVAQSPAPPECRHECTACAGQPRLPSVARMTSLRSTMRNACQPASAGSVINASSNLRERKVHPARKRRSANASGGHGKTRLPKDIKHRRPRQAAPE